MSQDRGCWSGGVVTRVAGFGLALLFGGVAVGSLTLSGCDATDGYDPSLRYDLRSDPLVLRTPDTTPSKIADSGKRDDALVTLPTLGGQLADPKLLPVAMRAELTHTLDELFGTPAAPKVAGEAAGLDLSAEQLAAGSKVYRRLCLQCHGLTGDGHGLAGLWVYPYPRDFRLGVFKTAAGPDTKPRFEALVRLVRHGVPGTIMQPFDLIADDEVRAATTYIIHLSLRGEVEFRVTKALLDDTGEESVSDTSTECHKVLAKSLARWADAQTAPPPIVEPFGEPDDPGYEESVRRGSQVFSGAGCAKCHDDYGRKETFRYDAWGHAARIPDLTRGEFRWGRDPADLMARIRNGIPGTSMPAHPMLSDDALRDVARFVRELPYPQRLPPDVHHTVYPTQPNDPRPTAR